MAEIAIPKNGRIKLSDGAGPAVTLTVPYTNGDYAESGDVNVSGYETETVFARDVPIGNVTTKRSGKKLKFSAVAVVPGSTNSIEDWAYAKGDYSALTSTAPAGFMTAEKLCKVEWQHNVTGSGWTTTAAYNYCLIKVNRKEGSPTDSVEIDIEAIAADDSWVSYTTS